MRICVYTFAYLPEQETNTKVHWRLWRSPGDFRANQQKIAITTVDNEGIMYTYVCTLIYYILYLC